jgi:hypothetical protein
VSKVTGHRVYALYKWKCKTFIFIYDIRFKEETNPNLVRMVNPSKKLLALGFAFTSREKIIHDAVKSLQDKGFLSA